MYNNKCFISYAHSDSELVKEIISPILKEIGLQTWMDTDRIKVGESIFDSIVKSIRESDIIIVVFNGKSTYVNFEVGLAIGLGKPILTISSNKFQLPKDIRNFDCIYFEKNNIDKFKKVLKESVEALVENVIDKREFLLAENKKLIGIQIGYKSSNYEEELKITANLIELLKKISGSKEIQFIQTSKGSLKSLLSIDFKSWTILIEKISFFKAELQKKNAENLKIIAETEEIKAKARKTNAEAGKIESETRIQELNAFFDIFTKNVNSGVKLQISDDVILKIDNNNQLYIGPPKLLNQENNSN